MHVNNIKKEEKHKRFYTSSLFKEAYIKLLNHTNQANPLNSSFHIHSTRKTKQTLDLKPYKITNNL